MSEQVRAEQPGADGQEFRGGFVQDVVSNVVADAIVGGGAVGAKVVWDKLKPDKGGGDKNHSE